jgi:hypothetical protein
MNFAIWNRSKRHPIRFLSASISARIAPEIAKCVPLRGARYAILSCLKEARPENLRKRHLSAAGVGCRGASPTFAR